MKKRIFGALLFCLMLFCFAGTAVAAEKEEHPYYITVNLTDNIVTIYVTASLGTRIKRYIDRCGVDDFNYSDKDEICSRVDRDFGMFLGIERMSDLTIVTSDKTNVEDSIKEILTYVKFSDKEN